MGHSHFVLCDFKACVHYLLSVCVQGMSVKVPPSAKTRNSKSSSSSTPKSATPVSATPSTPDRSVFSDTPKTVPNGQVTS